MQDPEPSPAVPDLAAVPDPGAVPESGAAGAGLPADAGSAAGLRAAEPVAVVDGGGRPGPGWRRRLVVIGICGAVALATAVVADRSIESQPGGSPTAAPGAAREVLASSRVSPLNRSKTLASGADSVPSGNQVPAR